LKKLLHNRSSLLSSFSTYSYLNTINKITALKFIVKQNIIIHHLRALPKEGGCLLLLDMNTIIIQIIMIIMITFYIKKIIKIIIIHLLAPQILLLLCLILAVVVMVGGCRLRRSLRFDNY
jgi:hypothetical protein